MNSTVLVRSAEELALAERDAALSDLSIKVGWRNLLLAIQFGMETRPLAGAVGSRIGGRRKLAAAFAEIPAASTPPAKEPS